MSITKYPNDGAIPKLKVPGRSVVVVWSATVTADVELPPDILKVPEMYMSPFSCAAIATDSASIATANKIFFIVLFISGQYVSRIIYLNSFVTKSER